MGGDAETSDVRPSQNVYNYLVAFRPFISYAREDREHAEKLYNDLRQRGAEPWIDFEDLRAGENWELAIIRAIGEASHFLALLSRHSINKRGFVQREMKEALEILQQFPPDDVFIVPVRLDETKPRDVRLSRIHWIDLFPNYDDGLRRLMKSVAAKPASVNTNQGAVSRPAPKLAVHYPEPPQLHRLPFGLLFSVFRGLAISLSFGLIGAALVYAVDGLPESTQFLKMYIGLFGTLVSLGLIAGAALTTSRFQRLIPASIEAAFATSDLAATSYFAGKRRFFSISRTVTFAFIFGVVGFSISSMSRFPASGLAEALMMAAAYVQWVLISYVCRKLFYSVVMLQSVVSLTVAADAFRKRHLNVIDTVVRLIATFSGVFLFVLVRTYYDAPFLYTGMLGAGARVLVLLPPVVAIVTFLVLNFLPRVALQQIYDKSIDALVAQLGVAGDAQIALETRLRDDLRRSSQPSWADLPISLVAAATLLEFVL